MGNGHGSRSGIRLVVGGDYFVDECRLTEEYGVHGPIMTDRYANCYGRLAVVSDVDDGGFCPECRQGVERICRAITKQVQWSDARIEVDVMHTGNECTE
jgi:hypothetical protein